MVGRRKAEQRAVKVLLNTYWSPAGWRRSVQADAEDYAFAKAKGFMFDPVHLSHDEAVHWAVSARDSIGQRSVTDAFVVSLRSRRLDLRSALGSYATTRHLVPHRALDWPIVAGQLPPPARPCEICGAVNADSKPTDLNVFNFERLKWGGVRHHVPAYAGFDLTQLALADFGEPDCADRDLLASILQVASSMPSGARLGDLNKAIGRLLPSNEPERRVLISILGYCGILVDPSKLNFRTSYVPAAQRVRTHWHKDDWPYPVCWWTGEFGVSQEAVADWFPECA